MVELGGRWAKGTTKAQRLPLFSSCIRPLDSDMLSLKVESLAQVNQITGDEPARGRPDAERQAVRLEALLPLRVVSDVQGSQTIFEDTLCSSAQHDVRVTHRNVPYTSNKSKHD